MEALPHTKKSRSSRERNRLLCWERTSQVHKAHLLRVIECFVAANTQYSSSLEVLRGLALPFPLPLALSSPPCCRLLAGLSFRPPRPSESSPLPRQAWGAAAAAARLALIGAGEGGGSCCRLREVLEAARFEPPPPPPPPLLPPPPVRKCVCCVVSMCWWTCEKCSPSHFRQPLVSERSRRCRSNAPRR